MPENINWKPFRIWPKAGKLFQKDIKRSIAFKAVLLFLAWNSEKVSEAILLLLLLVSAYPGLERVVVPACINFTDYGFNLPVGSIGKVVILLQAAAKEKSHRLVHARIHPTLVFFDDFVAVVSCLPVDQFH
jgi:hypothetical protein